VVKCSECGFIAARNTQTRELEEIEYKSRQDGNIGRQRYVLIPICLAMATNIDEEVKKLREQPKYYEKQNEIGETVWPTFPTLVKEILNQERECTFFTKWQQGFTPKEHREMIDRQAMLKWQTEREDIDKKWQIQQRWFMVVVAGIFTIIGGVIGAIIVLVTSAVK
jgi:hypothetical protein